MRPTVFAIVLAVGCGRGLQYTPTGTQPARPAVASSALTLVFSPDRPMCEPGTRATTVALYKYAGYTVANSAQSSIDHMRDDAAAHGFDGLFDVRCAAPGTVGEDIGACSSKAYVCEPVVTSARSRR